MPAVEIQRSHETEEIRWEQLLFETFYCQFKNCAEYNQWNENEKRHYLRWSSTGIAASMLWGTEHMSYKQLLTRLLELQDGQYHPNERSKPERHFDGGHLSGDSKKGNKKFEKRRVNAAAVTGDASWKEKLLKKIQNFESAQKASEADSKKISAQNDALSKEVDRLRHLQQLRSVPTPAAQSMISSTNQQEPQRPPHCCCNCGQAGYFIRDCPQPKV